MEKIKWILKHKWLFWLIELTWGLPMNIIGAIGYLACRCKLGIRHGRFGNDFYIVIGHNWGGCSLGCFFFTSEEDFDYCKQHEHGHSIQNLWWGFLFPFVIGIPSGIRYQYFNWRAKHGKPNKPYDSIWFEGQATRLGKECIDDGGQIK